MKKVYLLLYGLLSELRDEMKAGKYDLCDMVNFIYVMREIARLADDLRKEANGIGQMFENVACALYVKQNQNSPDKADPIRAALATGTPKLTLGAKLPHEKRDPEKYIALMTHFGIGPEALEKRVVKAYWPGICEQISQLAEQGKPLPPGINPDDTYPTYKVTIKIRKVLDEVLRLMYRRRAKTCRAILSTR
jgi:hypothetical protein